MVVAAAIALVLALIGLYGGSIGSRDPVAAVFLVVLAVPWGFLLDALGSESAVVNLAVLVMACVVNALIVTAFAMQIRKP